MLPALHFCIRVMSASSGSLGRTVVGPASITALSLAPPTARILYMNDPDPV